ncbi:uncharacterized protein LOC119670287 [Teleopsis dalmanni]|uniref:uncharacterized protein LOC119670287 n=1 Tax=Teleopsis dalmanni TaxID=139649 RepID=UPI0018CD215E|nr:uncharacterized protein LOC119670287 [Teleopsis dalmanni]
MRSIKSNRTELKNIGFKVTLPKLLILTYVILALSITHIKASSDYSDSDYSSSDDSPSSKNDDILETTLIEQAETFEKKQKTEDSTVKDEQTELPPKSVHTILNNEISTQRTSTERENLTDEEDISEDYDEHFPVNLNVLTTTKPINSTAATTLVPEYVRKGKAEIFPVTVPTPNESEGDTDTNISLSDYIDDGQNEQNLQQQLQNTENHKIKNIEDVLPLAMKFYQNFANTINNDAETNNLTETPHQQPLPLPQQQLLPNEYRNQHFHPNSSEEEYYEDSHESNEQQIQRDSKTTFAPINFQTSTVLPMIYQPNVAIVRPTTTGTSELSTTSTSTSTSISVSTTTSKPITTSTTTTTATASPSVGTLPTTITATATTTTTLRPVGKQGKQINISRRKLLPHEQLRNYIEDAYIRMPLAVIVDPSPESLEKTKTLWQDALRMNLNIKIVLVSLNASGSPAAYNFNNTRQFLAGLNSIKENDGGDAFIGIVHASELVPYDSAVFICTAEIPDHTDLVQDAAITLLKKRIRLYLIWYGERAISENETQDEVGGILGEVAIRSGGEILHIVGSENSQELEGNTLNIVADALRGSQEVDVPVDTTLASLHVKIDKPMRSAILETPNGEINLRKLVKFKSRILTLGKDDQRLDAFVPLTKLRKSTVFKLKMVPESMEEEYSVFVRADRKADLFLDDMIKRFDTYFFDGTSSYPSKFRNNRLQSITSALAAATLTTHDNLKFPDDDKKEDTNELLDVPKSEVETFSDTEIHTNVTPNETLTDDATKMAAKQYAKNLLQIGTTRVEMGTSSQILVAPGMMGQLYFEITNTRTSAVYHNLQVIDERKFLVRLVPQSIFIRPGETVTVTVTVVVPNSTPQGTVDKITFTCHGSGTAETTSLSLNLKVMTPTDIQDTTSPSLSWEFGNRCENVPRDASNCGERFWTLDITAQDWQTGILRLQSTPTGLIYRNSYTIGSTEPLKATYIASCCDPKVSLIAYDIAGNQKSNTIDVRDIVLTEASIAAITLGAILLILLIILMIVGIVWCCRRRRVVLDLPTYRSHSTRSME